MSKSPFITILTASFNSEATIRKTLESIRDQSFQDMEHIVIDGGSRDETLDILKEFENTYNLTWISEPDNGIADAMNKGIDLATGDYILFLHSDDYLVNSSALERASEYLIV
ncbi:MAG: glycosyltransferase [Deltaproteobacteria bacterium]|jgi:glycosyltransferase involved in cell wall biosynthesis|nr:glycosyltransferase [Deltaproteobacteria bacterium]